MTRLGWNRGLVAVGCAWALACSADPGPGTDTRCDEGEPCTCGEGPAGVCGPNGECGCEAPARRDAGLDAAQDAGSVDARVWLPDLDATIREPEDADTKLEPDAACAQQSTEAYAIERPVDIVFIIDNSGSMSNEIQAVRDNINVNFAQIIEDSGVDYRVIMLTEFGDAASLSVCIDPPLSGASCEPLPAQPENGARFFHYSGFISSLDSWCRLLSSFDEPDPYSLTLDGWGSWLRPGSFKVFVEITDDSVRCSYNDGTQTLSFGSRSDPYDDAAAFDDALRRLSRRHFGRPLKRNYRWYSIVGVAPNSPATEPWPAGEPLVEAQCSTAYNAGLPYQALSRLTGGLRYPVCEGSGFDAVFQAVAQRVVEVSSADCEFPIPDPPAGAFIDPASVVIEYGRIDGTLQETFTQTDSSSACSDGAFYIADERIQLCPATCERVKADEAAELRLLYGCLPAGPD